METSDIVTAGKIGLQCGISCFDVSFTGRGANMYVPATFRPLHDPIGVSNVKMVHLEGSRR